MVPTLGCDQVHTRDTRVGCSTANKTLLAVEKYQCRHWRIRHDNAPSATGHQMIARTPNNIDREKEISKPWEDSYEPRWKLLIAEGKEHSIPDLEERSLNGIVRLKDVAASTSSPAS